MEKPRRSGAWFAAGFCSADPLVGPSTHRCDGPAAIPFSLHGTHGAIFDASIDHADRLLEARDRRRVRTAGVDVVGIALGTTRQDRLAALKDRRDLVDAEVIPRSVVKISGRHAPRPPVDANHSARVEFAPRQAKILAGARACSRAATEKPREKTRC